MAGIAGRHGNPMGKYNSSVLDYSTIHVNEPIDTWPPEVEHMSSMFPRIQHHASNAGANLLLLASNSYAWGASGHEAVGYVTRQFLAPNSLAFVQKSLVYIYSESLGPAATWVDQGKYTTGLSTASTRKSCSVNQTRDCGDVNIIANYPAHRQEALKFLDHYLGDIGQPLYVEVLEVGDNDISVTCSGSTTNLHAIRDTSMIQLLLGSSYNNDVTSWANSRQSGDFEDDASSWISCSNTTALAKRFFEEDILDLLNDQRVWQPLHCEQLTPIHLTVRLYSPTQMKRTLAQVHQYQ